MQFLGCYINESAHCMLFSLLAIKLPQSHKKKFLLREREGLINSAIKNMAISTSTHAHLACAFGILGNIVSFLVYLAPLPTFYRIYKRKSTEGFQSIPYAVALFSAMLTLYYGLLKGTNGTLLITINSIGILIESSYLVCFIIYATKEAKIYTTKLLILFNVGLLGMIIFSTFIFSQGHQRVTIVGWICAVISVCVFVAPLSIMRLVIRTKSVEYMPLLLSFFLTLCSIMWFFYGFLINDFFVATPNMLGFGFGIVQMILYCIYKDRRKKHAILPLAKIDNLEMKQQQQQQQEKEEDTKGTADEQINMKPSQVDPDIIVLVLDEEFACNKILGSK